MVRRIVAAVAPCLVAVLAMAAPAGRTWTRASIADGGGSPDGDSSECSVSTNGRIVAFHSGATNLLSTPGGATFDVFVRDMKTGTNELVSRTPAGAEGNAYSRYPALSANGRWVTFESGASNLVAGDDAGFQDVFVTDRSTGIVTRVSEGYDGSDADGESSVYGAVISGNGRWVVFRSNATNLVEGVETFGYYQVYLRDLRTGVTRLVSRDRDDPTVGASGTCLNPSISANGRFVVFPCNSANLVPGSSNGREHVYVADLKKGTMARVSVASDGTLGDGDCGDPVVSNNGRWVAFYSLAPNLVLGESSLSYNTFLKDMSSGVVVRLSDSPGNDGAYSAAIPANGKFVVFYSEHPDLVDGDMNGTGDVFRYDTGTGALTRLSVDAEGVEGDGYSYMYGPSLSSNGKWLSIASLAGNLQGTPAEVESKYDIYVKSPK